MAIGNDLVLVADVGGTNTRVALARGDVLLAGTTERFANADHIGLEGIIADYLSRHRHTTARAAIALAGPVRGNTAEMTNLGWQIDASELGRLTGIRDVSLLNDLQAQGYALDALDPAQLEVIRTGQPEGKTKLVIGLGTGVNAAPVYALGDRRIVPPSESGHIHLPLHGALDHALAEWLIAERGFASVEDVLAGAGLERLYRFHLHRAGTGTPRKAAQIMADMQAGDRFAQDVGRHYVRLLAQVTADLALVTMPGAGIFYIGGVARAFLPWLTAFGFEQAFANMGRFSDMVRQFPIHMVQDDFAALHGCASYLAGQHA